MVMLEMKLPPGEILAAARYALHETNARDTKDESWRASALDLLRLAGDERRRALAVDLDHLLDANQVARLMGWTSRAAVNLNKQKGRLLAIELPRGKGDRFPSWQFNGREVRYWVEPLLAKLGNGWPALQFLLKIRPSLGGVSYCDLLFAGSEGISEQMLAQVARIGDMDAGVPPTGEPEFVEAANVEIAAHGVADGPQAHA
jgi:hypothetical protein